MKINRREFLKAGISATLVLGGISTMNNLGTNLVEASKVLPNLKASAIGAKGKDALYFEYVQGQLQIRVVKIFEI